MARSVPKARARRRRKKLLLVLGTVIAGLLLGEGFLRVRFWFKHGTFAPVHTFARDPASGIPIPVPGRVTSAIHIDSRGFRNGELEVPKPAGRVRIAYLGASATFCAEVSGNDATWPSLVTEEIARAHPSASVDHVNAGVAGHLLRHMEQSLEHRLAPLAPDVIVIYEASNDISKDSLDLARAQGVYAGHGDDRSFFAEASLLWSLVEKNVLVRTRSRAGTGDDTPRVALDLLAMEASYRARYASLLRHAQAIAPLVVAVTYSQRARSGMQPEELERACVTHFYYMPYLDAQQTIDAFAAYNGAIRAAAADTGALLIDGEDEIPADDAHFADSVHFTDAGCRAMAARVARRLESDLRFQEILGSRKGG